MFCLRSMAVPSTLMTATSSMTKKTTLLSLQRTFQPNLQLRTFSFATAPTTTRPSLSALSQPSQRSLLTSSPLTPMLSNQARAFSASSSLAGRRNTFNPSRRVQKRRHGFLARIKSKGGQQIIARRRAKGRKNLSW
ncbi:ribosomal protein L34-domain-containing protein [Aspergillus karnatakaensis]|uniref:mitochondrial 54S ribosomal protein bL34m n=1 Tax=Aspergillus karnatakaensis TaxID=1810916 RepID=UPI003CCD4498